MSLQYSGGYATADRDQIEDQRQSSFITFCGAKGSPTHDATARRAWRPPGNGLIAGVSAARSPFVSRNGSLKIRPPKFTLDGMGP